MSIPTIGSAVVIRFTQEYEGTWFESVIPRELFFNLYLYFLNIYLIHIKLSLSQEAKAVNRYTCYVTLGQVSSQGLVSFTAIWPMRSEACLLRAASTLFTSGLSDWNRLQVGDRRKTHCSICNLYLLRHVIAIT